MTTTDSPPPPPIAPQLAAAPVVEVAPPAPPAYAVPAKRPVNVLAIVSFLLTVLTVIGYLTVKIFVAIVFGPAFVHSYETISNVFGVLGLLSVIPIAVSIVLAHVSLRKALVARRGRALGIASLAISYLMLALYFNRIIVSVIAVIVEPHSPSFLQDNFYWA